MAWLPQGQNHYYIKIISSNKRQFRQYKKNTDSSTVTGTQTQTIFDCSTVGISVQQWTKATNNK